MVLNQSITHRVKLIGLDRASWLTSFFMAATVYLTLSKIFPPTSTLLDQTVESLDGESDYVNQPSSGAGWEGGDKEKSSPIGSHTSPSPKYTA